MGQIRNLSRMVGLTPSQIMPIQNLLSRLVRKGYQELVNLRGYQRQLRKRWQMEIYKLEKNVSMLATISERT
jgi:biopolymer transport protein ExbB/TolQ